MTVRPAVVIGRLGHLGAVLAQLERLRALDERQRADPLYELAAERAIHVAIEAILDVGHHVLAGRGLPVPATYRDVVPALAASGVISAELGVRLDGMAGMRNILVHDYVDVDARYVWSVVDDRLDDLRQAHAQLSALPELTLRG